MKDSTIHFDFHLNPGQEKDSAHPQYHARITNSEIIGVKEIAERLTKETTLTNVDLTAVLMGLRQVITDELAHGNVVSLDGIGKFEPILGILEGECSGTEKGNDLSLKTVRFRPHKSLVQDIRLQMYPCARRKTKHSVEMTETELYTKLTEYFRNHSTITRKDMESEFGLTRYKATKFINRFVADGRLSHPGNSNDSQYMPVSGHFGTDRRKRQE